MSGATARRIATPPGVSLSAYARHRGVSLASVRDAVHKLRLRKALIFDSSGKRWLDVAVADREWEENRRGPAPPGTPTPETQRAAEAEVRRAAPRAPPREEGDDPADDDAGAGMTLSEASAIEKRWKGRMARLEYRRKAGELVEASEVEAGWTSLVVAARAKLLGVPVRARQRLPHLTREDAAVLDELVREALEELAAGGGR